MLYLARMFCKLLSNQRTYDNNQNEQNILWEVKNCESPKETRNDKHLAKKEEETSDNEEIDSINSFEIV
jgi:hypothetical protein